MEAIKEGQLVDSQIENLKHEVLKNKLTKFCISDDGVLAYKGGKICMPNDEKIKSQILYEAHNTPYMMHLGNTKAYRNLKKLLVAEYEERCGKVYGEMFDVSISKS